MKTLTLINKAIDLVDKITVAQCADFTIYENTIDFESAHKLLQSLKIAQKEYQENKHRINARLL